MSYQKTTEFAQIMLKRHLTNPAQGYCKTRQNSLLLSTSEENEKAVTARFPVILIVIGLEMLWVPERHKILSGIQDKTLLSADCASTVSTKSGFALSLR